MRKQHLAISVTILLLLLLVTACGKSATETPVQEQPQTSASTSTTTPTVETGAETKTYTDSLGREVVIPTKPERIVTTQYLPDMLALGIKPIGVPQHLLTNFASVKDLIDGIENLGPVNELNLEKTVTLNPDLIIAMEGNQELIDKLSKIAPTIVVKWSGSDPFQHLKDVADVLGLNDKADQWIAAYNKKSEEARAKLAAYVKPGETFGTVVIGGYEKGQLRVYGDSNVGYTLFNSLQFPMTNTVKTEWDKGGHDLGMKISLEKLPEFASADRLFVVKFDNDQDFLKQVEDSMLWNNLPAVKNNKVYVVNESLWFSLDVLSFEQQLDDAVKLLAK
ncbi:ABC transporter substrate-binding protein [Paenibacillus eucommiae]|uniref:Iron complex transport system substrate-binding protein n=1 Tax=Paenibacillus eucommiae TaxID=1355755 RepID=A0ABS4IQ36_9BACL|nr:ABC transporter substrate-binding protein [Paenibacillus eucommiae]MBP1989688.1 iron complex transport system substrate-binding protein [Paenibacillus eucommiae]